jgi:histidinol-phosphate aminotransferase
VSALAAVARRRVGSLAPYRPGGAPVRPAGKLSANEAPLGPSPRVRAAIAETAHGAHRYGTGEELRALLAAIEGLAPDRVVLTNGSDELCFLLATLFVAPGAPVILSEPCYKIDELVTRVQQGAVRAVPLRDGRHDLEAMARAAAGAAVVWLPSPHTPTGRDVPPAELEPFLRAVPADCLVVLDQAYGSYVDPPRRPDVAALLARHPNLVVQRTFSKAEALAGLRVGYGLAAADLVAALDSIRAPFNVNVAALAAARAALADGAWRDYGVELVRRERARLLALLAELGIEHHPSQANFVAARPPRHAALHAALARAGIVVRDGADLGYDGWLRISIGAPPQMAVLRRVLAEHMGAA